MSGIAGLVSPKLSDPGIRFHMLDRWQSLLKHRGPDNWGWYYDEGEVLLFQNQIEHPGGQNTLWPIPDEQKCIWILFNGYLCEWKKLRKEMKAVGHRFTTNMDAEVIIHLYEEKGINAVNHLRGEFAFVLFDIRKRKIFLVRDRFGVKPLYYAHFPGKMFCFASEAKAIFADETVPRFFDRNAIRNYVNTFSFGTETIFEGIRQVSPGHFLCYDLGSGELVQNEYWRLPLGVGKAQGNDTDLTAEFRHFLREAVRIRLPEEANYGAFLSGGIDSSSVVALMHLEQSNPFPLFTLGFERSDYDESPFASRLALQSGMPHHVVKIGKGSLKESFIRSVWHSEIPVVNTHGAAKMLLSQEAASRCKILFSGEGADELLWGYHFFQHLKTAETGDYRYRSHKMSILRGSMAGSLKKYNEVSKQFGAYPYPMMRHFYLRNVQWWLLSGPVRRFYGKDTWDWKTEIFKYISPELMHGLNSLELSQLFLLKCDFPAYILNYLGDRQEMSMSVESRPPFLDHKLAEFTCRLPDNMKLRDGMGKYILREALKDDLPEMSVNREKQVFYTPALDSLDYYGDPGYFETYLENNAFKEAGIFNPFAYRCLIRVLRMLPTGHWLVPVLESLVIFVLSLHILYDLYINHFDKWSCHFAGPDCMDDFLQHNAGTKYTLA